MPIVSEAVATALFTITRILLDSVIGTTALILFSKLPGGSSAKFWYEQPDVVSKLSSLFHPFGPTGKRGNKTTNAIAVICMILALALNILPTILSKLSPISANSELSTTNATLSPLTNIFIPTLTDINLPRLSDPSHSRAATIKFLCSYLSNGCTDSKNNSIASIVWDKVELRPIVFYHPDSISIENTNDSLLVSINDTFATETTPQQSIFIAKNSFSMTNVTTIFNHWINNNLTAFYSHVDAFSDLQNIALTKYDYLHADQFHPLTTPDLSDFLRQGRRVGEPVPTNGNIDRAERWTAIHRTNTLSSVLWQSVNAHSGTIDNYLQEGICFFCQLIGIKSDSSEIATINQALASPGNNASYALHTYIDHDLRLSTTLCLLQPINSTGISYWCIHTYSQLWNVYHELNPYQFFGSYENSANGLEQVDQTTGTPFPFFPPPQNLTTNRTYIPIVPIFEIRSKGQCQIDWDFRTSSIQNWMRDCADSVFNQAGITDLEDIARNIWQLGSTITVGGFLITADYYTNQIGIYIGMAPQIVMISAVGLCLLMNLLINVLTSPIHRRSLYEAIRLMVPDSRDPYNVQKVLYNIEPTNTLRLVDSAYDKRVSYLKLNNRLIVTLSERQESLADDDYSTLNNSKSNLDYTNQKEMQSWSKRQLINF